MQKSLARPADLELLLQRVASLTPSDQATWGRMTVHQMLCHTNDALLYALGDRKVDTVIKPPLPAPVYKWLALYFPRKWPQDVPTTPEMCQDTGCGGTRPADFAADRAAVLASLQRFAAWTGNWPPHPIFQAMSKKDWLRWAWLHTDHHLRQFNR